MLLEFESADYRQFINGQFRAMRTAIWSVFQNKKWIDDFWKVQNAEDKIYQLKLASEIGFHVPDTLITSDPIRVKNFYEQHKQNIVVKLLSSGPMIDKVLFTKRIEKADLRMLDSLKMSPSIFQECIQKAFELRITVAGDKIFTTKIFSQEDEQTSVDWRTKPKLNDFEVKMEPFTLPTNVESSIKSFMRNIGLRFGCIDMIVTPKNEYVFLEINPNGQWYFVQLRTGAEIAKAIADLLIG
jgi:glutathione synthase/RimK-type ligase-like ATP-grasp enzyme